MKSFFIIDATDYRKPIDLRLPIKILINNNLHSCLVMLVYPLSKYVVWLVIKL